MVFYVAIVLLLIGTNLRAGRSGSRGARFKKHVVEFNEGSGKGTFINDVTKMGGGELCF